MYSAVERPVHIVSPDLILVLRGKIVTIFPLDWGSMHSGENEKEFSIFFPPLFTLWFLEESTVSCNGWRKKSTFTLWTRGSSSWVEVRWEEKEARPQTHWETCETHAHIFRGDKQKVRASTRREEEKIDFDDGRYTLLTTLYCESRCVIEKERKRVKKSISYAHMYTHSEKKKFAFTHTPPNMDPLKLFSLLWGNLLPHAVRSHCDR